MNGFRINLKIYVWKIWHGSIVKNLSLICLVLLVITMFSRNNVLYAIAILRKYAIFPRYFRNISKKKRRE